MRHPVKEFVGFLGRRNRYVKLYDSSTMREESVFFFIIREDRRGKLVILHPSSESDASHGRFIAEENGELIIDEVSFDYHICPCNHANALALRELFPFTRPQVMGLTPAIGTGDRIGLSTPGHIRALKGFSIFPVLAQQSARELTRTGRTPQEVMDDVSWAVFQEGYRGGFAADADHLKDHENIEAFFEAGFTMYTLDPSDYVDDNADGYDPGMIQEKLAKIPWDDLRSEEGEIQEMYSDRKFNLSYGGHFLELAFSGDKLSRTIVKYSPAIAHVSRLKAHLDYLSDGEPFDLEVSFDETRNPTSALEHFFIASELRRLNVQVQGLAIHFVGKFEKAIDYEGDLQEFERTLRDHVVTARSCGPYKLSIHSGSDKFSVYPSVGRLACDLFHLKTAGTSYLEALRVVARHDPSLFREIVDYSSGCFERDKKTYQIGTELSKVPRAREVGDEALERVFLEGNSGRQLLHVTFGSVLTARDDDGEWLFRDRLRAVLIDNEEEHYGIIATHFKRYLKLLGIKRRTS